MVMVVQKYLRLYLFLDRYTIGLNY